MSDGFINMILQYFFAVKKENYLLALARVYENTFGVKKMIISEQ